MLNPHLEPPEPPIPLEPIVLSDRVAIDFHPGAGGLHWATLHTGTNTTEIGTVRTPRDIDTILTMVAGILIERPQYPDDIYVSADGSERWVLIGSWLLNARLDSKDPNHLTLGSPAVARELFVRRAGWSGKGNA